MSGPLTVGAPESSAGSRSVKTLVAETAIESCANTWTTAVAPLAPLADWAWSRTLTVEFAGTVTPVSVGPVPDPVVGASFAVHPTATRSSGSVIMTVHVSAAVPGVYTTSSAVQNTTWQ